MSSNVGLTTPRGSGTSGYVQRNLSLLKPRDAGVGQPYTLSAPPKQRKPDQNILLHDRLREIEVKVLEYRDKLEEENEDMDEEEVDEKCESMRKKLIEEDARRGSSGVGRGKIKGFQVHELAEAKERESERLRRALGLKKGEGEEGEHPMARQEKRRRERLGEEVEVKRER